MGIPHMQTAQRLRFDELPGSVRASIEDRLGATVVSAASQDSGFTPGLASRLLLDDGQRVFVKAASGDHEWPVADSYREEIRKVSALPNGVPVPRLRWHSDDGAWVVLCFDDIAGRPPRRPWDAAELRLVLDTLTPMAVALTPVPAALAVDPITAELAEESTRWSGVRADGLGPQWLAPHLDECTELARAAPQLCAGETLVHLDLRDDNIIIADDRQVWICDWNWPAAGAAWVDLVCLLISAYGDGHDADLLLATHPVGSQAGGPAVDALLSLLGGYFLTAAEDPVPHWSPYIRLHQRWYAGTTLSWLRQRRSWR